MNDEAWILGDLKTNPKIINGIKVRLLFNTITNGKLIPAGVVGIVVHALTPKVTQKPGTSPYFANVDLADGTRIRVPHGALKILKEVEP
jgi:hypothetical protein